MKLFIAYMVCLACCATTAFGQITRSSVGKHAFHFDNGGKLKSPIRVFYYSPRADDDSMPIVVMLHGAERDASAYLNGLINTANKLGCKIVAPEFDKEDYAGADKYNLGNVYNRNKKVFNSADQWSFSLIEPLFDYVVSQTQSQCRGYYLYGHSAGAQFVHRYLMFVQSARVIRVAMANAGWYTLPGSDYSFPYGLKGSPVNDSILATFFALNVNVLLGTADTDRDGVGFNVTAEADAQGRNRFERGKYYFDYARQRAADLQAPFNWTLTLVPNVGHNNEKMGEQALPWLLAGAASQ